MFRLENKYRVGEKVRGIFSTPIQYEVRVPESDWSKYFGKYQNQKWEAWDSNSCWCLSAVNCAEDQLEWLWKNKMFSQEAKDFFVRNDYIDSEGDFSCSERYLEILSGVHDDGNDQMEAWKLMQKYGLIPRKDLTYSADKAKGYVSKSAFNADYFNSQAIIQEMRDKGQKFLTYVNIARQTIGKTWTTPDVLILKAALKQAPLQIGVPVPTFVQVWNSNYVSYAGEKSADHAIELYGINGNGDYLIFDQYMPNLKVLSKNYYLPFVTQGILTAVQPQSLNPIPQDQKKNDFWTGVFHWFMGIFDSKVPIGTTA